jgi:Dolichyl-phosphate-mannose-protein mannosyltransferase
MQGSSLENKLNRVKPLQVIALLAALQLIIAFMTEPLIFTHEEAMWQYIGRNWVRNGLIPYAGGVDNKSPLIFLIFGLSDRMFGVNFWFPRLLGVAVQSVGIYFIYKIAEKTINRQAGIFAISFYGLSLLWRTTGGKYVSFTETYAITCVIVALYLGLFCNGSRRAFAGGLFAGLGLGFRFSAAFGIIPAILFVFRQNPKAGIRFLSGLLVSLSLLVIVAYSAGIRMNDFLFYGLTDNFGTGSPTGHSLAWKAQAFADGFFYSELILFYPALVAYFILNRRLDFLKAWLICEFLGIVLIGIYARNHFKDLLPVLSLMSAFVINWLMENHLLSLRKVMLGVWLVFFPKSFEPLFAIKRIFLSKSGQFLSGEKAGSAEDENLKKQIGIWIRDNTHPEEKVFVAGYGAQIQAYSERLSPSIYFNVTQTVFAKNRLYADLSSGKPALIAIPRQERYLSSVDADIRSYVASLALSNYHLDTCLYNYNIFRYNKANNFR